MSGIIGFRTRLYISSTGALARRAQRKSQELIKRKPMGMEIPPTQLREIELSYPVMRLNEVPQADWKMLTDSAIKYDERRAKNIFQQMNPSTFAESYRHYRGPYEFQRPCEHYIGPYDVHPAIHYGVRPLLSEKFRPEARTIIFQNYVDYANDFSMVREAIENIHLVRPEDRKKLVKSARKIDSISLVASALANVGGALATAFGVFGATCVWEGKDPEGLWRIISRDLSKIVNNGLGAIEDTVFPVAFFASIVFVLPIVVLGTAGYWIPKFQSHYYKNNCNVPSVDWHADPYRDVV